MGEQGHGHAGSRVGLDLSFRGLLLGAGKPTICFFSVIIIFCGGRGVGDGPPKKDTSTCLNAKHADDPNKFTEVSPVWLAFERSQGAKSWSVLRRGWTAALTRVAVGPWLNSCW